MSTDSILSHVERILTPLITDYQIQNEEFVAVNPRRDDRNVGSFRLNLNNGFWSDFALDDVKGKGLTSYLAYIRDCTYTEAKCWIDARLTELNLEVPVDVTETEDEPTDTIITPVPDDAPDIGTPDRFGYHSAEWTYHNPDGKRLCVVRRYEHDEEKTIIAWTFRDPGGWQPKKPDKPWQLYNLNRLADSPDATVLLAEGEKATDAAERLLTGVGTCTLNGSGSVKHADLTPLYGRDVIILPDADDAGRKYAVSLCAGLEQNANTLSIIDVWKLGWTDGEDIADQDSLPADFLDNAIPVAEWLQPDEMVRIEQDQKLASLQDTIVELAGLNAQSYELRRSDAAEALGIRAAQLDTFVSDKRQELHPSPQDGQGQKLVLEDPEPWHEPVDGHGLAEYVRDTFKRHCILPAGAAEALTLFTFHTHCFEVADFSPHLILMSAVKRSGKTTVLHVLSQLVSKPLKVEHCTTSAIFRSIELAAPTLLIDEGDSFIKENEQIRGLLNSSFERGGGVLRVEGDEREPRLFRTFTPTAIATIKELPGTIMDRAIVIPMKRKSTNETIEKFRRPSRSKCTPLTKKLRRWAEDNINNLREVKVNFPSSLHDRAADACEPLLQIATLLNWEREAHEMIKSLLDIEEFEGDLGLELLADIKSLIPAGVEKFTSEWLRFELAELEGQPWASYSSKETISQLHLSKLLKPFDIRPKQFRLDDKTRKRSDQTKINYRGYKTAWFEDSWARYVLPEDTVEPATSATPATSPVNTDSLLATERSGYTEPATQKSASLPDVAPIPATPANPVAGTDPVEMQVVAGVAGVAGLKGLPEVQCPVTGVGIPIVYVADAAEAASRLQSMLSSGGIYGADTETQPRSGHEDEPKAGLSPATGKLRLVQITDGEQVLVLDMNHIPATILGVLSDARLVFHNVQFDLAFLLDAGIRIKRPACTQLAVAALTHDPMVSLANACKEYLGIEIQKDQQTSDWTLSELSPKQIEYASLDAVLTLSLYNALTMKINMQGYRQVRQCIPAIADASHRGVLIDRQKHQALVNKWQQEKKEAVGRLRSLVGEDVNLESGKQLSDWLRDNLDGVEWPETPKGQLRTDKDTLEAFSHVELVQPLLDYRRVSHRLKTWGETYQRHMTEDNRLHPNFLLLGARSGRMSCRNPNVQNIPRDEAFRACFIAPDGYKIVTADFSQIELRIAGILSGDTVILNAYSDGKDLHKAIVARVTGKPEHEISADERKLGKALNFGLLYGAGAKTFQTRAHVDYGLDIKLEEAVRFKQVFDRTYSKLRWWQKEKQREAELTGSFTTLGGRLCTYKNQKRLYTDSRNYPIQSAAADLQLSTISRVHDAINGVSAFLINFVHDELVLEVRDDAIEQISAILREEMTAAFTEFFPDSTPHGLIEIGIGDNYAEAK